MAQKIVSAKPLFARLDAKRGELTRVARRLNMSVARIANWRARGIPFELVDDVAPEIGLTRSQYLLEAGITLHYVGSDSPNYLTDAERELLEHYRRAAASWQRLLRRLAKLYGDKNMLREAVLALFDAAAAEPAENERALGGRSTGQHSHRRA